MTETSLLATATDDTEAGKGNETVNEEEKTTVTSNPEETGGDEGGKDSKADKSQEGAPEQYTDFKLPEGIEVNTEVVTEFKTLAKELNLTQDKAQKLIDLQVKVATKSAENMQQQFTTLKEGWLKDSTSDKEFGGTELNANLAIAKKALDKFGTEAFRDLLESSGFGNHPEVIRILYRMGKAMSDDEIMNKGTGNVSQPKDPAKILFPNMN